jgi:hypothetical protein
MSESQPCPRCQSVRLAVLYFDATGRPVGGHLHCPDCGPRHTETIVVAQEKGVRNDLLKRKAS